MAPVWHTIVLIVGILAISATGPSRVASPNVAIHRMAAYSATIASELILFGWVWFGLRLRKISLRSLFGSIPTGIGSIALDCGIAAAFWLGSMIVLAGLGLIWQTIEAAVEHKPWMEASTSQLKTAHTLSQLAPSNGREIAMWVLVCLVAAFVEEAVFRGYLQRQFSAWARGSAVVGVIFSAVMFGSAHAYEGVRSMFLIAVFGALFSLLALFRRSLRPGMIAHFSQDLLVGLLLALLHAMRLV